MGDIVTKFEATGTVRGSDLSLSKTFSVLDVNEFQKYEQSVSEDNPEYTTIWSNNAAGERGTGATVGAKFIIITNTGDTALEIAEQYNMLMADDDLQGGGSVAGEMEGLFVSRILPVGAFLVFPTQRAVGYSTKTSAGRANTLDQWSESVKTDGNGYVKSTSYFGWADTNGVVPGTLNLEFFLPPWVSLGFTATTGALTADMESGLTASTTYYFKINLNGDGLVSIPFTVDATDTTWGQPVNTDTGVLGKITTGLETKYLDGSLNTLPTVAIVDGDIRFTGATAYSDSTLVLDDASASNLFGSGTVPNNGSGTTFNSVDTFTTYTIPSKDMLLDQGDGTGVRASGGRYTVIEPDGSGDMYKEGGTLEIFDCPPHSSFKIHYKYDSAHSGQQVAGAEATANCIIGISARSLSQIENGVVEVLILN